jgi:hypothetical protein
MIVAQMPPAPQVRCREIEVADLDAVTDTLVRGFPERPRSYWTKALETLRTRPRPSDLPTFGFLLETRGSVVGVLLLIFSRLGEGPDAPVRCNTSSLCVDEGFRGYSPLLSSVALRLKHVTYMNTSASRHTWPIIEALGYRRYSQGQFFALPALSRSPAARVARLDHGERHRALPDYPLLRAHAEAGCLALICEGAGGPTPFVFLRRRIRYAPFGVMQLIYCRDTDSFVAAAGPLGRFLLAQGAPCVICDADGPIAGLAGVYVRDKTPRFYKGPRRPPQNDLAFTEMVLFGP